MRWKKHAPRRRTAALVLCVLVAPGGVVRGVSPVIQKVEWVQIDGSRHPEMIPEWSAWEDVFSTIAGGSKELPPGIRDRVTAQEAEQILRESEASVKRTGECNARILALRPLVGKEKQKAIEDRRRSIRLECRWQNLYARDRIMAALAPAGITAMNDFVALVRAGTRVTVAKSELAFFRQPQ
jgi:hypothetical protein